MLIEFFGSPGTGKTAVAQKFAHSEGFEYISTHGQFEKYWYLFRYMMTKPHRFFPLLFRTIIESGMRRKLLRHKLSLLPAYIVRSEKAYARSKKATVVLDEGLAQYGLSLHEHKISEAKAAAYVKKYVGANLLVLLAASPETCRKRMEERGVFPRAGIGIDHRAWLELLSHNAETFRKAYGKKSKGIHADVAVLHTDRVTVLETVTKLKEFPHFKQL